MVIDFIQFEREMKKALDKSSHVKYLIPKQVFDDVSKETVLNLTNGLSKIEPFGDGIKAVDDNGDILICQDYGVSITHDGKWLSSKIQSPSFDIDMSGNVRKSIEAEAFYICVIISGILKDECFSDELDNVTSQYDFDNMSSITKDGRNYISLLDASQGLQSYKANVICKFSIVNQKRTQIRS